MNNDPDIKIEEKKRYAVEDLLQTFDWMDRRPEEVGVDEEYLGDVGMDIEGKLFGAPADGSITFDLRNHEEKLFQQLVLYIYCDDLSFSDCIDRLKKLYGEPYSQGEEPYVQANGGAVEWFRFYTGKGQLEISKGEKFNFYTIRYQNGEAPEGYQHKTD